MKVTWLLWKLAESIWSENIYNYFWIRKVFTHVFTIKSPGHYTGDKDWRAKERIEDFQNASTSNIFNGIFAHPTSTTDHRRKSSITHPTIYHFKRHERQSALSWTKWKKKERKREFRFFGLTDPEAKKDRLIIYRGPQIAVFSLNLAQPVRDHSWPVRPKICTLSWGLGVGEG